MEEQNEKSAGVSGDRDLYWARSHSEQSAGIVVATTWMFSKPRQFKPYSRFYASCNWDSLISHPEVINLWSPRLGKALAVRILDVLAQEVIRRPRPIVFATFSGGFQAALYKILQILQGSCEGVDCTLEKYQVIRDCYTGQIHDSSPIDFVSKVGADFVSHPTVIGTGKRIGIVTWMAHCTAKIIDFFLLPTFENQRAEMWSTIYKSAELGPILILCSKDDELAPFKDIQKFSSEISSLGCKVTVIVWDESSHVEHLRRHTDEYKSAVKSFLDEAGLSPARNLGLNLRKTPSSDYGDNINVAMSRSITSAWSMPCEAHTGSGTSLRPKGVGGEIDRFISKL